jgi:peptide/nickel transport system substrate-binding protein
VQSPVERTPDQFPACNLPRRGFLSLAGGASTLLLLSACKGVAGPSAPAAEPTVPPAPAPTREAITLPQAAPAATAPAVGRVEPKGKLVEGMNASISPSWFDPQENPPQVTPYNYAYALHDAMVKHMPGKPFAPSLAEDYQIALDYKSAIFKLRQGAKFHDGSKVTSEDVKFTYENYRGASSSVLKSKLDKIELPDDRTVKFSFKEPFVDFLMLYGSPASGAGWIVPKAYYEKVGKDGFKNAPIGAGPFRFVKQTAGSEVELEAFPDYWRKTPSIKTLVFKGISEDATRLALLKTGEIDAAFQISGELLTTLQQDTTLRTSIVRGAADWLELGSLDSPDHPFKDVRARQAVSLAIDRQAINQAQMGGLSTIEGNWVPEDWQGALQRPVPPTDLVLARKLLADAGFSDGFDVSMLTPLPPQFAWAERLITQLRQVNIRTKLNTLERGAFYEHLAPGPNRLKGIVFQFSGAPGDAASRIRENAVTGGAFSGLSLPEVDDRMKAYDASLDLKQRKQLLDEVQAYLLDQYWMIPCCRNITVWGFGPRVVSKLEDISGSIPQYGFLGPYEDIEVKDS